MLELFMERKILGLRACDAHSEAQLCDLPQGKRLRVKITIDRSGPQHRLFFSMLTHVADACGMDLEELRATVTVGAGHVQRFRKNGEWREGPASIQWHKMDQTKFAPFFDRACDVIEEELDLKKPDLMRELREAFPGLWAEYAAWQGKAREMA